MTLQHYMKQPRSMLCRKLERIYIEESEGSLNDRDFEYNFLPYRFRHIGSKPSTLLELLHQWMI